MQQKKIKNIIKRILVKLYKIGLRMEAGYDQKDIHELRVCIKKLRAFLRLLSTGRKKKRKELFPNRLKKIFRTAGKIRNLQLQINRVNEFFPFDKKPIIYLEQLQILTSKHIRALESVKKKNLRKFRDTILDDLPPALEPGTIKLFFEKRKERISKIFSEGRFSDEELHRLRKNLKDIIFIFNVYKDDARQPLPGHFWNETELKYAEKLAHELGLYHDTCISLSLLGPARLHQFPVAERKALLELRNTCTKQKESALKKIPNHMAYMKSNFL